MLLDLLSVSDKQQTPLIGCLRSPAQELHIALHLLDRHAGRTQAAQKLNACEIAPRIFAVALAITPNRIEQSKTLVITQRMFTQMGQFRNLLDGEVFQCYHLSDSVRKPAGSPQVVEG